MGAERLRGLPGPRLFRESARILLARTPVARCEGRCNSGRVKLFLYYIGKAKDPHANAMAADYIQWASRYAPCQMLELKPARADFWSKHPSAKKILLDPAGRSLDSAAFVDLFAKAEMLGHD